MRRLHRALNHRAVRLAGPILGLACSAVFISRLDLDEVGSAFGNLALWWMVPVLLFGCVNLWLRAVRWGVLLAPVSPLPTAQLLGVGISAALAGLSLPARGGDAVKVFLAIRLPGVKLTDVAAAELLERIVDGLIFGTFISVAALAGGVAGWPLTLGLGAVAVYLPTLLAIPIASWYLGSRAASGDPAGPVWHPRRLLDHAVGAAHRRGPRLLVRATQLSVLAWAAEAVSYYCLLVAFGWLAPPTLPFAAVGVANFAFAVPGAPAGVGTFHMPVSSLLVDSFGAEPGLAAAYAVVLHLAVLAPVPIVWVLLAAQRRWVAATVRTVHVRVP
ncbi:MAG TPA: lysylphosphatidylglycerol synthase transmembrane domain-containing protein [Chloroflexota bacterium]|nr:lysylphosphatidylglycerol synthase transmembrane domain-containing protein [Chloroflexota bacterium]